MKYHFLGYEDIIKHRTNPITKFLPYDVRYRNNEILNIKPKENLLLGNNSLRHTYEKLILATGLEPNYSNVEGITIYKSKF